MLDNWLLLYEQVLLRIPSPHSGLVLSLCAQVFIANNNDVTLSLCGQVFIANNNDVTLSLCGQVFIANNNDVTLSLCGQVFIANNNDVTLSLCGQVFVVSITLLGDCYIESVWSHDLYMGSGCTGAVWSLCLHARAAVSHQ